jgi:hypothetical protein
MKFLEINLSREIFPGEQNIVMYMLQSAFTISKKIAKQVVSICNHQQYGDKILQNQS